MAKQTQGPLQAGKEIRDLAIDAIPGLRRFMEEIAAEFSRQGAMGSSEMANAIFNGRAFVLYGPGQYPPANQSLGSKTQDGPERLRGLEM